MFDKQERKENWKVLLLDRGYLSDLKQNQFTMDGDPLETRNDSQGFGKYKIKIYEDNNIEDDPKFRCKGRIRLMFNVPLKIKKFINVKVSVSL